MVEVTDNKQEVEVESTAVDVAGDTQQVTLDTQVEGNTQVPVEVETPGEVAVTVPQRPKKVYEKVAQETRDLIISMKAQEQTVSLIAETNGLTERKVRHILHEQSNEPTFVADNATIHKGPDTKRTLAGLGSRTLNLCTCRRTRRSSTQ